MKVGDRIRINIEDGEFYFKGDYAVLTKQDKEGFWFADFANQENAKVITSRRNVAVWCVGQSKYGNFSLVEES